MQVDAAANAPSLVRVTCSLRFSEAIMEWSHQLKLRRRLGMLVQKVPQTGRAFRPFLEADNATIISSSQLHDILVLAVGRD